jgi:hypothetical protein
VPPQRTFFVTAGFAPALGIPHSFQMAKTLAVFTMFPLACVGIVRDTLVDNLSVVPPRNVIGVTQLV